MNIATLCLWACMHLDLSIGVHPTTLDDPEITDFDNPIGQVDVSYTFTETSPISIGIQHTSSIIREEDGYGFNYFYAKWRVK